MNIKVNVLIVFVSAIFSLTSCSLFDKKEPIPSWIQIDKIDLVDNPNAEEGSLSNDITDAWVYIDDNIIGVFELPATIPILDEGEHTLLIGPGIKVSTVSTLRDNYLFYQAYESKVNLVPGEILDVNPVVMYRDQGVNYEYYLVESFEDSFIEMKGLTGSDAEIMRTTDPDLVFEGKGSGILNISDTASAAGFRTTENFIFPTRGKVVYLELDYYTEFELTIGMHIDNGQLTDQTLDYLTLKASTDGQIVWRKAYIALTSIIDQATNFTSAYIYFVPGISTSDPKNGKVLIDNVKIMYQL